jgi:hypothetical protein
MLDGVPNKLSAQDKVKKIDEILNEGGKKMNKELKRRLQNRRSALVSRLRKQSLIESLKGKKSGLHEEIDHLKS